MTGRSRLGEVQSVVSPDYQVVPKVAWAGSSHIHGTHHRECTGALGRCLHFRLVMQIVATIDGFALADCHQQRKHCRCGLQEVISIAALGDGSGTSGNDRTHSYEHRRGQMCR